MQTTRVGLLGLLLAFSATWHSSIAPAVLPGRQEDDNNSSATVMTAVRSDVSNNWQTLTLATLIDSDPVVSLSSRKEGRPSNSDHTRTESRQDIVAETFQLLEDGEKYLQLTANKDIVLLLGNTGSGKSTLGLFLSADNEKLLAVEKGEGQFVIEDRNEKISRTTVVSKTIYPELFYDPNSNTSFVDCPGYKDTRNASYDIAATYLIKRAVDQAERVKLIFVVNYNSVRAGGDRNDFPTLIKHAASFIKNVDKFNDSIGLVVTKVDNIYKIKNRKAVLVTDTSTKSTISSFLNEVKGSIETKISEFNGDATFHERELKLVNIILSENGNDFNKFALFRRPDEAGPLSESTLLQNGKKSLENLVHNATIYASKSEADFGYTISDNSKIKIFELVEEINNKISKFVDEVAKEIQAHFRNKELTTQHNPITLQDQFNEVYEFVAPLLRESDNSSQTMIGKLVHIVEKYNILLSRDILERIAKHVKYLDFLQVVSDHELKPRLSDWLESLNLIVKYLHDSRNWYGFLSDLQSKLSEFEFQKDTTRYNVADLNDWGETGRPQGIQITEDNLKQFLGKIESLNIRFYDSVKENAVEKFKLSVLNGILDVTLEPGIKLELVDEKLKATGHFIKLSDVETKLRSLTSSGQQVKFVEVFALNTVFIDADLLLKGRFIHVSVIAPTLDVQGTRRIELDGAPGEDYTTEPTAAQGKNGKSGVPGGAAGSFVGVGVQIINGQNLKITAKGGNGGAGQDGGRGANGRDGRNPEAVDNWEQTTYNSFEEIAAASRWPLKFVKNGGYYHKNFLYEDVQKSIFFYMYGANGTKGGNGGDGGSGGAGGAAGNVHIVSKLTQKSDIQIENREGQPGQDGQGGWRGVGGRNGCSYLVEYIVVKQYHVEIHTGTKRYWRPSNETCSFADSGNNGRDGSSFVKPSDKPASSLNPSHSINNYKSYLRETLINVKQDAPAISNFFDNSIEILSLYDTSGLLDEMLSLESQFYRLQSKVNFLPLYQTLLNRISIYAVNPHTEENSLEFKKVHNYLYTAVLSKINSLKDAAYGFHIINIKNYLDVAISNIRIYQEKNIQDTIKLHNKGYQEGINRKTSSARDFIDQQITVEIENINTQIDGKIDLLINETIEQQKEAEKNKKDLFEKREDLKRTLKVRGIFSALKIAGSVMSFMGPYGAAVGGLVGATSSITESFVLGNKDPSATRRTVLASGIKTLVQSTEKTLKTSDDRKILVLENSLKLLTDEIKKYPEHLGGNNMTQNVQRIKSDLATAKSAGTVDRDKIKSLEAELKGQLEKKHKELSDDISAADKKLKKRALKVIDKLNTAAYVADVAFDSYLKYKDDEAKIEEVSRAIRGEEDSINKLKQYEDRIFNTMKPMISGMIENIDQLVNDAGNKSQVGLDVAKWQIQSKIRDMKLQMQQFTEGFNLQDDLARCIEKLEEAMTVLINVYDRIQNYQEQKKLADLIAAIGSREVKQIQVRNPELRTSIDKLEILIKSNIILSQYEKAISTFKQFIFPFAASHLVETRLPVDLQVENNTQMLVSNAVEGIESLQKIIVKNGAVIYVDSDRRRMSHDFQGNGSKPRFYDWESGSYNVELSQLLSGKEIALNADVRYYKNIDAVKFNVVGIRLKSLNESLQTDLNEALQDFEVRLTHLGNSYYRCDQKFYVIPSDSLTISYSFRRNGKGEPKTRNGVYDKLANGDVTLSPYAMWKIQLVDSRNLPDFSNLGRFKNQVNLELIGLGKYVQHGSAVCHTDLEQYYTVDKSLSEVSVQRFSL